MIVDELKNSILQIASEGKLVRQGKNTSAFTELKHILEDKKDDKKYKYVANFIEPFNIPNNWIWVKLEDICIKITDGTHKTPKYQKNGVPFISVKDLSQGYISFDNTKFISEKEHENLYKRCNPEIGDLLITKVGTTGVPAIVETNKEFSLFVSVALLKINKKKIYNKYLYYIIKSPFVQKQVKDNTRGIGNKNWVLDAIKKTLLPLPPIEEQQRIVNKIEELFSKLDEIKPIEEELNELKILFPNGMRKSILQDAYSGTWSNNYSNWNNKRIMEICDINTGNSIPENVKKSKYSNLKNGYNYIATKDLNFNHTFNYENGIKIPYNEKDFKYAEKNDILLCIEGGSAGRKIGLLNENVCFGNKLCKFHIKNNNILSKYLYYYLQSPNFLRNFNENLSGIIGGVSINKIKKLNIKFPSLDEQQRIVNKLEELLPLCDDIERIIEQ